MQILKRFAGQKSWSQTSFFWRVLYYYFISYSAVHVTESTKASLGDYFNCDPVAKDEIDDEILSGNQLNTYLIWPYKNEYNIGEVVYLILDLRS